MKCKCGNTIDVKMAAKMKAEGASLLTSVTTIATIKCHKCGAVFQVPINSKEFVMKE